VSGEKSDEGRRGHGGRDRNWEENGSEKSWHNRYPHIDPIVDDCCGLMEPINELVRLRSSIF
jgi:hypothetical protein